MDISSQFPAIIKNTLKLYLFQFSTLTETFLNIRITSNKKKHIRRLKDYFKTENPGNVRNLGVFCIF